MKRCIFYLMSLGILFTFFSCGNDSGNGDNIWAEAPPYIMDYYLKTNLSSAVTLEYYFSSGTFMRRTITSYRSFKDRMSIGGGPLLEMLEGEEHYMLSDSMKITFADGRELWCYNDGLGVRFKGIYDGEVYDAIVLEEETIPYHYRYDLCIGEDYYNIAIMPE